MSKVRPIQQQLPSDVVEKDDWLSNVFQTIEEDNGAVSPFDLADIFPQLAETIPNPNNSGSLPPSPQTTTTSLGKHALASAEVAAVTTIADTAATATNAEIARPVKKVKKSVREKARRDALNDRLEDLSKCLSESPKDELKTDKSSIVIAARACILVLREQVDKANACIAAERSEWAKTKQELIAEKILVEQKLQNFMAKMPFATAIPSAGGSKHTANAGVAGTVIAEETDGDTPLAPILVVSTTTAEEDAKWRAPLA